MSTLTLSANQVCWTIGDNDYGQQCNGTKSMVSQLTAIHTLPRNIKIVNIETGCSGSVYFLCDNNKLYVAGFNQYKELGIKHDIIRLIISKWITSNDSIPTDIIKLITNFIDDFQVNNDYKIPICIDGISIKYISFGINSYHKFILTPYDDLYGVGCNEDNQFGGYISKQMEQDENWGTFNKIDWFSNNNIKLKQIGCLETSSVFLTESGQVFVCGDGSILDSSSNSKEIQSVFDKAQITDICCGFGHILALNEYQNVYSWGYNQYYQLGLGNKQDMNFPTLIKHLIENDIKITKIHCGGYHNVILSDNGNIYTFGHNWNGECGTGNKEDIIIPKLNDTLKDKQIININCGDKHNAICTAQNEWYLWGSNQFRQCLVYDDEIINVTIPTLYDNSFDIGDEYKIIAIYCGYNETRVVTQCLR